MITVSGLEAATNADVLNGTRLISVPVGAIRVECQAADAVAANNYTVSLTLPTGEAPWLNVDVPAGEVAGLAGVIDERVSLSSVFPITAPGHVTLSFTETGDTEVSWRVTTFP